MSSASLPILMSIVALALSSCTATSAKLSTNKDLSAGQENPARPLSAPISATAPRSVSTPIVPMESQAVAQNPVDDLSAMNSSTADSSAIANSSAAQVDPRMALAQHLTNIGAKIYTTDWCPTCKRQKRNFGEVAFSLLTMINCEEKPDICADAGVRRYPTWEINGRKYERGFPLNELAQLSNYSGPALPSP